MVSIIAVFVTMFLYFNDSIDKRINKAVTEPSILRLIAKNVQLPFIIFDENEVWRYEHNASGYIEDLTVEKNGNEIVSVTLNPKHILTVPPIIESLNFTMEFAEPRRQKRFSWVFTPADTEYESLGVKTGKEINPENKLVRLFKITIIPEQQ